MRFKRLAFFLITIVLLTSASQALSLFDWRTIETADFIVFYPLGYEAQAREVLFYLEKYQGRVKQLTGNDNKLKTRIVLQDIGQMANGYADSLNQKIGIYTYNPYMPMGQSWLKFVSIHELIHINQLTNASGPAQNLVALFGNDFSPNVNIPLWMVEGITVYGESQNNPYEGRLNDGYYDAEIMAKAKAGQMPSALSANYYTLQYPADFYYMYGGTFFRYLSVTYGEDKLAEFFRLYSTYYWVPFIGSVFPCFGLDYAARTVYGRDFPGLFEDWAADETTRAQSWEVTGTKIENSAGIAQSFGLTAFDNKLYYFNVRMMPNGSFSYGGLGSFIEYDIPTGREKILAQETTYPINYIQRVGDKIYIALLDTVPNYANVDFNGRGFIGFVYVYHLPAGTRELLFSDELMDFAALDSGRIIYVKEKKTSFGSEIWEYADGRKKKIGEVDQLIGQLRPYKNDFIAVSMKHGGSWDINILRADDWQLRPLAASPWHEYKIKVSGDSLYYTANYDQRVSSYGYDLLTNQAAKLSRSSFANDGVAVEDKLYYIGVAADGEHVYVEKLSSQSFVLPQEEDLPEEANTQDLSYREGKGGVNNFGYLFWPSARFYPVLALGEDALAYNAYSAMYSSDGGIDFAVRSRLLMPLTITYSNVFTANERKSMLSLDYPYYLSSRMGLSYVYLNLTTDFSKTLPGVNLGFSGPRHKLAGALQADLANQGINADLATMSLLDNGSINFAGSGYQKFDKIRRMRGVVTETVKDTSGYQFGLDYLCRLLQVRNGFWNPNVFLGDIYGGPFFEYSNMDRNISSYGYELQFEAGAGFWLNFVPRVGVAWVNGENTGYFNLDFNF